MKKMMKNIVAKLIFNMLKKLHELHNDLPLLPERMKLKNFEKLIYMVVYMLIIYMIKVNILFT